MTKILVIDNYDSFVYTLVGYLEELGATTTVVRNDEIPAAELASTLAAYNGVLVSPGPGNPQQAGITLAAIAEAAKQAKPLLGVCLGHQALGEAFGATVTHAEELMHGKTSRVTHNGDSFYTGVPTEFTVTRYHSLAVVRDTVPEELEITCETANGVVMGLKHRTLPLYGVQYHPESVLTEHGYQQLGNWLEALGATGAAAKAAKLSPVIHS